MDEFYLLDWEPENQTPPVKPKNNFFDILNKPLITLDIKSAFLIGLLFYFIYTSK